MSRNRLNVFLIIFLALAGLGLQSSVSAHAGHSDSSYGTNNKVLSDATTNPESVQNTNTNIDEIAAHKPTTESNMLTKILYGALFVTAGLTGALIYLRMRSSMRN